MFDTKTQQTVLSLVQVQGRSGATLSHDRVDSVRRLLSSLPADAVGVARNAIALGDADLVCRLIAACTGPDEDATVELVNSWLDMAVAVAPARKPREPKSEPFHVRAVGE
jgi:hypothetical protein